MVESGFKRLRQSGLVRNLLFMRRPRPLASRRLRRAVAANPARESLTPILVDYYSRDGSTLMMRLLASSAQIAVGGSYPFEHKYFAYLWRWSRLLTRRDWNADEWAPRDLGSILQERDSALMGPPPWRRRGLIEEVAPDDVQLSESCFEFAWREFSRRATARTRIERGEPDADVRYYAEKHLNSWLLDLRELPSIRLLVLLRDPRDTYASLVAFRSAPYAELGQREASDETDYLRRFIERHRERLRWIARLEEGPDTAVVRYEELVRDLPGVARRLESWLSVTLDAEAVAGERQMQWVHRTAPSAEESIGRWHRELPADVAATIGRELGPELEALGFDAGGTVRSGH